MRLRTTRLAAFAAFTAAFAACDDATGVPDAAQLTLSFRAAGSGAAASPSFEPASSGFGAIDAVGSNGTLSVDEVQIVVDEFKLELAEGACEDGEAVGPEGCATFEAAPYYLDLPLDEVPVDVASGPVPAGSYIFVKLETKDLASSAGDDEGAMSDLRRQVLTAFPRWPDNASLRIAGSFDPDDGGDARPFVVYFHAEVKVELSFDPALQVSAEDEVGVVVEIDPVAWFTETNGTVTDLSVYDYETTTEVVEFEAKMADGFTKIEIDG